MFKVIIELYILFVTVMFWSCFSSSFLFLILPLLSYPCNLMSIFSVKFGSISFFLCELSVIDFGLRLTWGYIYEPLDEHERGEWKAGLKLNIQKTKIIASGVITSWQIDGETMETVRDFTFGAPKSLQMVTAAMKLKDICSLEEKLQPTWTVY